AKRDRLLSLKKSRCWEQRSIQCGEPPPGEWSHPKRATIQPGAPEYTMSNGSDGGGNIHNRRGNTGMPQQAVAVQPGCESVHCNCVCTWERTVLPYTREPNRE